MFVLILAAVIATENFLLSQEIRIHREMEIFQGQLEVILIPSIMFAILVVSPMKIHATMIITHQFHVLTSYVNRGNRLLYGKIEPSRSLEGHMK